VSWGGPAGEGAWQRLWLSKSPQHWLLLGSSAGLWKGKRVLFALMVRHARSANFTGSPTPTLPPLLTPPPPRFVGGINKPKIVTVTDSEGATHRQLVSLVPRAM